MLHSVYLPFDCVQSLAEICFLDSSLQKFSKELLNQNAKVDNSLKEYY